MKNPIFLLALALLSLAPVSGFAKGEKDTASFIVSGNCDMCKTRIEAGAKKGGALKATWDESSHVLQVVYDPAKTTLGEIHQGVANAGYDTEKVKAPDNAYQKLPGCCQYEREKK